MAMTEIDAWAHALARGVAHETGWHASEIYRLLIITLQRTNDRAGVEASWRLITRNRIEGEALDDALRRVAVAIDAFVETDPHGRMDRAKTPKY